MADDDNLKSTVLRANCSVYNPCARYAYCRNNLDGEWTCVCKFWWSGTLCNEMTSSGTQVIVVGVLVAVVLLIFHGLGFLHYIRHRRTGVVRTKEVKLDRLGPYRELPTILHPATSSTRRIRALIVGIITVILAAATLITRWILIQPIHDDIVDKFNRSQPLFFKRHPICDVIEIRDEFNIITFPAACLLFVMFSVTSKRVSFHHGKGCKGYIGVPIPFDVFAHVKRTFAAVIFSVSADDLIEIANRALRRNIPSSNDGVIIAYLRQVLKVFVIGFRRYPTLAAVHIDTSFSLICAALYNLLDFGMTLIQSSLCRNDFYPTDKTYNGTVSDARPSKYLKYYGTGANLVFFQLLTDIPRYLFLSYISVKLVSLLVKRLQHRHSIRKNLSREQKNLLYASLPDSIESRYVRQLLNPKRNVASTNRLASKFRFIYTWRDDFRFSSRVICVYAAIYLLLFFITVQALVRMPPSLPSLRKQLQLVVNVIVAIISPPDTNLQEEEDDQSSDFRLPTFYLSYVLAIIFTLVVTIIQLSAMLASIRRNLLQAFRGDHTEIPPPKSSRNDNYVTGNFRFAGTLIGYVILAYVFLGLLSFIVAIIIGAAVTNGGSKFIEDILKTIIPAILFIFFKMYLNKILGKYVFLQHEFNVLSLNNRRLFMIFLYFNIFLDAFLGLFAAISRLLRSTFGGILYMCRLDYSPLGRKLETKDAGFSAYCGFIHVECAHRHPVLLCFMSHLLRTQLYGRANQRWSKARHRWALAVLLLNNPTLIYERKRFPSRSEENSMKLALIGRKNMRERKNGGVQIELTEINPEERF